MPDSPLVIKFNTPFKQAAEAANQRGVKLPSDYYALPAAMRSREFTVSYLAKIDQIQAILTSLQKAQVSGISLQKWQKEVDYKQFGITKMHAETVFRNAMQTHYAIGHWESFQRTKKAMPYLRYVTINDSRTSECCRALSGIIRKVDDPFWASHTPPNHHNCRSTLQALTESQAQKRSLNGTGLNQIEVDAMNPQKGWDYNPATAHDEMLKDLADSKIKKLPDGVVKSHAEKQLAEKIMPMPMTKEAQIAENLLFKLIANVENVQPESQLKELWSNKKRYDEHIDKRIRFGEITSEMDYQNKTFDVLANASKIIIAIPKDSGMISGKVQLVVDGWVVLLGENGEIVTSYPFDPNKETFENRHIEKGDLVYEHGIIEETRKILNRVFGLS